MPISSAVFLDRDGTLIRDTKYLYRPDQIEWLPGVLEGLKKLSQNGFSLIVVSNQSGIAREYYTMQDLKKVEDYMHTTLMELGVEMSGYYYCPHLPEITGECSCRKPRNGMIEQAFQNLPVQRQGSWMLGDRLRDLHAGRQSKLRCAGVFAETQECARMKQEMFSVYDSFSEVVYEILKSAM